MDSESARISDINNRAIDLRSDGRLAEAILVLGAEVQSGKQAGFPQPGSPADLELSDTLFYYWSFLASDGQFDEALRIAQDMFGRFGRMPDELRWSLSHAGRYEEAEVLLRSGPEPYEDLLVGLGYNALEHGDYDIACSYFLRRLAFRCRDMDFRHTLNYGCALLLAGRADELRQLMIYLLTGKRIRPASFRPLASILLALAHESLGDEDQARDIIAKLCGTRTAERYAHVIGVDLLYQGIQPLVESMLRRFHPSRMTIASAGPRRASTKRTPPA